jgi:hypothetical protein
VPHLTPSWDGNKFPRLGDADIVGPMVQQHGDTSDSGGDSPMFLLQPAAKAAASAPPSIAPPGNSGPIGVAARIGGALARKASSTRLFREFNGKIGSKIGQLFSRGAGEKL